jgi:hypothetical protein
MRAARSLLEERVEKLGVKKRSYPISRELKLVALYRRHQWRSVAMENLH